MTKNKGVVANKGLIDAETIRDISVRYFETLNELDLARKSKTVDCDMIIRAGEINNDVFSRGMIDETQFVENFYTLQSCGTDVKAADRAKFPQTLEYVNVMTNEALDGRNHDNFMNFWPRRYTDLFNAIHLQ